MYSQDRYTIVTKSIDHNWPVCKRYLADEGTLGKVYTHSSYTTTCSTQAYTAITYATNQTSQMYTEAAYTYVLTLLVHLSCIHTNTLAYSTLLHSRLLPFDQPCYFRLLILIGPAALAWFICTAYFPNID